MNIPNRTTSPRWLALAATAVMLLLSGCGDDDDPADHTATQTADSDDDNDAASDGGDRSADEPTAEGTVTLNGETTDVTDVYRCIPIRDEPGNLDLTAFMGVGGYLIVYVENGGTTLKDISLNNVDEGAFGSSVFSSDLSQGEAGSFAIDGNRISGSGTVYDSFESGASVEVAFDFTFPDDSEDCSL